ncbi:MAG: flagellar hook-length control protein FliK [Roseburia sp.]|nr:flagellar hook-length control protein FliK [Roseburia sp.]
MARHPFTGKALLEILCDSYKRKGLREWRSCGMAVNENGGIDMQITDMLGQYNRNLATGTEIAQGTQGIRQVMSPLQQMSVGNVFEGNINSMENGVVTLGLPDGKTIQARLDQGVSVNVGQSMFFQVKANNGAQIAIRPFSNGVASNPTLLAALDAASLQANAKMLTMVNAMMEQSMPIDKQSLLAMARLVSGNERMDVNNIVQMAKLGIPITEEMAAQFENYKSDQYAVLDQLESVMKRLPQQMTSGKLSVGEMLELNQKIAQILVGEGSGENLSESTAVKTENAASPEAVLEGKGEAQGIENIKISEEQGKTDALLNMAKGEKISEEMSAAKERAAENLKGEENQGKIVINEENVSQAQEKHTPAATQGTPLTDVLSGKQLNNLDARLSNILELSKNPAVFEDGKLNANLTSKELLSLLTEAFSSKDAFTKAALSELVSSREYRTLLRSVMEEQWLLKPEDLKAENKVNELYQRLNRQMDQMEQVLKNFGQNTQNLSDTASSIRNNIQFMNQLNQTYAYVQIPLKLSGQNAHSDLYVYTGRKRRGEEDEDLTAFLHLDLEHLGSTDVSVRMRQKKVTTNFYLSDDLSYDLIMEHLDELEERLAKKGYQVKIQVNTQEETPSFVDQILKGQPSAGGMVHRYSFDVRA